VQIEGAYKNETLANLSADRQEGYKKEKWLDKI